MKKVEKIIKYLLIDFFKIFCNHFLKGNTKIFGAISTRLMSIKNQMAAILREISNAAVFCKENA